MPRKYNSKVILRTILRVINAVLILALLAIVAAGYWLLWRPLPQTSGEIKAPLAAPVEVTRDALGVPHVRAANEADALFTQGYVTASERLWQMDALRRYAGGNLSQIVGRAALDADRESCQLRLRRIAEAAYVTLNQRDKSDIGAYARGVNYYIATHHGKFSFEFTLLGYDPRPWSAVDTLLIWLHMYRTLTNDWKTHLARADLLEGGDANKIAYLFPVNAGGEVHPGSNAWAVSGAHTVHGHPQMSNDMHLQYSLPGIWFMVDLSWPGLHLAGVALPGVPAITVGHNDWISWGVTNLGFNVQDLYDEKLDDRTGHYLYQGTVEQARLETDLIQVKGESPVEFRQWVTRHGPVVSIGRGHAYSLRWAAAEPVSSLGFFDIVHAHNWDEFNQGVARYPGPGQNFVYADVAGNIGYHASGRLPIRRGYSGDAPVDGSTGQNEWEGFIPYEKLPSVYNPPQGVIVTANQNPFPDGYPYLVSGGFASPFRARQIHDRLLAKAKLGPEDTLAIEKDVYSPFEEFMAKQFVAAFDAGGQPNADSRLKDAVNRLRGFAGQMDRYSAAALIVSLSDHYVRTAVGESASPGKGHLYTGNMSWAVVEDLLRTRPNGWFRDWNRMLCDALGQGVREADRLEGPNVSKWELGKVLKMEVDHPVGSKLPLIAFLFDVGPVMLSGSATTVKQTVREDTGMLGPSERYNAVVGDWDQSLLNVPFGESGHLLSGHYKDQWDAYYNGRSFPMQYNRVDVKSTVRFVPQ